MVKENMEKENIHKKVKGFLYIPPFTIKKGTITITNTRILFEPNFIQRILGRSKVHDYEFQHIESIHPTIEGKNKRRIAFEYNCVLENKTKTVYLGISAPQDPQEILDLLLETIDKAKKGTKAKSEKAATKSATKKATSKKSKKIKTKTKTKKSKTKKKATKKSTKANKSTKTKKSTKAKKKTPAKKKKAKAKRSSKKAKK